MPLAYDRHHHPYMHVEALVPFQLKDCHAPRFQQKMVSEVDSAQNPARDPILAGI